MKKILGLLSIASVFAGCIKDPDYTVLTGQAMNAVRFSATSADGSFPTQLYVPDLSADEEIISLDANRAKFEGSATAPEDIDLEYKINPAAIEKYNADNASDPAFKPFVIMPDSTYSIQVKNDIIKKGEVYAGNDSFNIIFYPQKINTTINYILPLTVTSSKYPTAPGTGTILYYLIGNPISGGYNWDFNRWNTSDGSGPLSSLSFKGEPTTFVPLSATKIEVASGYYIQPRYEISFTDNNGTLTDFSVAFNSDDVKLMSSGGVEITNGPNLLIADPVNKHYKIQYAVLSGGTAARYIIDEYYK